MDQVTGKLTRKWTSEMCCFSNIKLKLNFKYILYYIKLLKLVLELMEPIG